MVKNSRAFKPADHEAVVFAKNISIFLLISITS